MTKAQLKYEWDLATARWEALIAVVEEYHDDPDEYTPRRVWQHYDAAAKAMHTAGEAYLAALRAERAT